MFERAVAEDPNYLEARRMLARNYRTLFREFRQFDAAPKAVDAFERANDLAQLAPDHPASDMARGDYHQLTQAFDLAEQHYRAARQARPNDASVLAALAAVQAAQGRDDESTTTYEEALSLDPRSGGILQILARRYTQARRYAEAEAYFDRGIVLEPDNPTHYFFKTLLYLYWDGSTERAQGVLEAAAGRADVLSFTLVSWDFDDELVLRIFADHFDDALERRTLNDPADSAAYYFAKGDAAGRNGTGATAAAYYDSARVVLERRFELESELPTSGIGQNLVSGELGRGALARSASGPLGLAYARLGNREAARRMVAGIPANEFSLETPTEIYLLIGDYEAAVDLLERLSGVRQLLSVPLLRIDPLWDPLRDHPRFQALLARGEN
jgi:serine/threonine-protein kinase